VWNGLFFGSIAAVREYYPPPSPSLLPPPPFSASSNSNNSSIKSSGSSSSSSSSSCCSSRRAYDFGTGLIAGCVATVVNTPFDVCKTRVQCMTSAAGAAAAGAARAGADVTAAGAGVMAATATAGAGAAGAAAAGAGGRVVVNANQKVALPWVLPFLRQLYREEGFCACFKGLNARLYRAGPGSGVLLVAYEGIVKLLSEK